MKFYASSEHDNWETPKYIKIHYAKHYDPCPLFSTTDGLIGNWGKKAFVNPPFSELKKWAEKAIEQSKKGCEVTLLVPLRPSTKWYQALIDAGGKVAFFRKRLRYNNADNAPFESCLIKLKGEKQ